MTKSGSRQRSLETMYAALASASPRPRSTSPPASSPTFATAGDRSFDNPEIIGREGTKTLEEGLSCRGSMRASSARAPVRALDREGQPPSSTPTAARRVAPHEMDHLEGKLFVDYLSELKRQRIRKRLEKARKSGKSEETPRRRAAPVI